MENLTREELEAVAESLQQSILDGFAEKGDADPIVTALQKFEKARLERSGKKMTLPELERIVLRIANVTHCRYFMHFNHPHEDPWLMAIQFCNPFKPLEQQKTLEKELLELGFQKSDGITYYTIERQMP